MEAPLDIKAFRNEGVLKVTWANDAAAEYPFKFLRCACACAACVHEFTGERLLDPDSVPDDVSIEQMELVGAYAIRIRWSDGHDTGLYTWETLAQLDAGAK